MSLIKRTTWYLASFLLGGAIGGAIALLYAPESGKHLRRDISRKTNDLIEDGKKMAYDSWNDAKDKAESTIEIAKDYLNTNVDKIVRKTEKAKDALKCGFDAYNNEIKSGNEQDSSLIEVDVNVANRKSK
jgi:gas vesicle protein